MKKAIIWILLGIVVILVVCFCPYTKKINAALPGYLVYENDAAEQVKAEVAVRGKLSRYLFRRDRFDGCFSINGTELGETRWTFSEQYAATDSSRSNDIDDIEYRNRVVINDSFTMVVITADYDVKANVLRSENSGYHCLIVAPADTEGAFNAVLDEYATTRYYENSTYWAVN